MKAYVYISLLAIGFASCGDQSAGKADNADTPSIPDSVPRMVRLGNKADWAYKPDTMMSSIVLGNSESMREFKRENGDRGTSDGQFKTMTYCNTRETEELAVFVIKDKMLPFGFRLIKKVWKDEDLLKDEDTITIVPSDNYASDRNFSTSHGIYLGMPVNYVQSIYKSQEMMMWTKGDTTYLSYAPADKDKEHFHRFAYTDYSATYKFVNDICCVIEMFVRPEAFEEQ